MKLSARDRVLIVAPHPDDESLACGGLIQRAHSAGADVHIVFVTNGDDNPWPQRFVERRLKVSHSDKKRWGRRRRAEALAAMAALGLPESAASFLSLPDQGLTQLLLNADEGVLRTFTREIERWRPTLLVVPSGADTHPDHSAVFVLSQLALARLDETPRQLRYIVHFPRKHSERRGWTVRLGAGEISTKRQAIRRHETQMALSRHRFLAYAKPHEVFYAADGPNEADAHHPIISGAVYRGALRMQIRLPKPRATFNGLKLCVAFESLVAGSVRWSLTLPATSGRVGIENLVTGESVRFAAARIRGRLAELVLPVSSLQPLRQVFVKLKRRTLFFDDAGWREIPAATRNEQLPVAGNPLSVIRPTER